VQAGGEMKMLTGWAMLLWRLALLYMKWVFKGANSDDRTEFLETSE
jgi:hypothetical protein